MYYKDKINSLKNIFNSDNIEVNAGSIIISGIIYPIIDDVIILSRPQEYTSYVKNKLRKNALSDEKSEIFSEDIQFSFGEEWKKYEEILPEHQKEFHQYFDIVELNKLESCTVCDLGCGNGRWSYFLKDKCKELILVDFSDAIFVARKNLSSSPNCIFFMCDLKKIPFKGDFANLIFSLGVLHHLPTDCLQEVRNLKHFAPELLIFLYYALDNRPAHFRIILSAVTFFRKIFSKLRSPIIRNFVTTCLTFIIYVPLIYLGKLMKPLNISSQIPLYDFYKDKSIKRIKQDVYDRFFTGIEQRVTKKQIEGLSDTFSKVTVSENLPYWHFICKR
ncbi:MAG: class I SAM-dependent methyltransferase [bacterium]